MAEVQAINKNRIELTDKAYELSTKLAGLLLMCRDEGVNQLADMHSSHRSGLLWLASDLACDLKTCIEELEKH